MALDSTGFKRKRFADLLAEMEAKAKEAFGQQLNTSERSPMGIILRLFAWFLSLAWQNSEDVYNSGYVNTATGANLSRLGPYVGIQRIQATKAPGSITIMGTAGYTVPTGFRLSTPMGIFFETLEPILIGSGGIGSGSIQAIEPGRIGNVAAGQITVIVNPNPNVTSVINSQPTGGGREIETDTEFRDRFVLSVSGGGAATVDAIRAALLRTPGVRAATVIENYTNSTDSGGRPAKSFEAFVLGGTAEDIGQTILTTKAAGIEPWGAQTVTVKDAAGFNHSMKFSYAAQVATHLRLTITKNNSYPADGIAQLKTALVRYIGGEDADGTLYVGLSMGDDIIHSRLIAAAYSVAGVTDVTVELSKNGSTWAEDNLAIAPNEVAQASYTRITVVEL